MLRREPSIRLKLGLLTVVPVLLAAVIVGGVLVAFLTQRTTTMLVEKTQRYADMSAMQLRSAIGFSDRETARETLDAVVRDPDVVAVQLVTDRGISLYKHGTSVPLTAGTSTSARRIGDRIAISVPVISVEGPRGELLLSVSTDALDRARIRMFAITGAVALSIVVFALLIALPIASRISRRVRQVSQFAIRVAGGDTGAQPVFSEGSDEVAQTANAVNMMVERLRALMTRDAERAATERDRLENMVARRTEELADSNRATRLVLDNVNQGLLTVTFDGTVVGERSRMTDELIGHVRNGDSFARMIASHDPSASEALEVGFMQLVDDILPLDVAIDQLPREISARGRALALAYKQIPSATGGQHLLVTVTDVSTERERREATEIEAETAAVFRSVMVDRHGARRFLEDARKQIQTVGSASSVLDLRNALHTLKGNAALIGLDAWVTRCHDAETSLGERGTLSNDERQGLVFAWGATEDRIAPLLQARDIIEVSTSDFSAIADAVWREGSWHEVRELLRNATLEPTLSPLSRLAAHTKELADRREPGQIVVQVEDRGLRLDPDKWSPLWSALTHVARNVVVHAARPGARTTVTFRTVMIDNHVAVEIADDGRGVQWDSLRERARDAGLAHDTREDLISAMFTSRITTRISLDEIGGRGVGLAAVAVTCRELGVTIDVITPARGTTFRFHLPVSAEATTPQLQPPSERSWQAASS